MKLSLAKTPLIRDEVSTKKIMIEFFILLSFIFLASILIYGLNYSFYYGLRVFLIGFSALLTGTIIDVLFSLKKVEKKDFKHISNYVINNFSYISTLIFALTLPVGTPIYVVVLGSIFAVAVAKYLFGGFGYNIFNPAAIARIFVGLSFSSKLTVPIINNLGTYDLVTGPTMTGAIDWSNGLLPNMYDYNELLFGGYVGAIGETFTILILAFGIILMLRKVINYRQSLSYLGTIILISITLGLFLKVDNVFLYVVNMISTGGIMFGAIFMISDPVTSPRSNYGKIIFGIGAAFFTMMIRLNASYPEGVAFAIIIMNMIVPTIDSLISGSTNKNLEFRYMLLASMVIWSVAITTLFTINTTFKSINNETSYKFVDDKPLILNDQNEVNIYV